MALTADQRMRLREASLPPTWTAGSVADLQSVVAATTRADDYLALLKAKDALDERREQRSASPLYRAEARARLALSPPDLDGAA